jgi:WD40 repeat protein
MPRLAKRQVAVTLSPIGRAMLGDYVHRVAFASDGTRFAACSASGQVAVWEGVSLNPICELKGHQESALTLDWHPTRRELATGGQDGVVRIWDGNTGEERAVLPVGAQGSWVEHLAWSPDGQLLAGSAGKVLRIWNTDPASTPQLAAEVPAYKTTISAVTWMPRGGGVVASAYGGAWLWKIGQEKPVRPFPYDGALLTIAVSSSGQYLASGNLDGSVHLFRTDSEQNWHMSGYPVKVTSVRFDHNGLNLFTASGPSLVSWNMKKFEGSGGRLFKGHLGWIQEITCHPNRSLVATVGEDGLLCIWEPQTTKPLLSQEVSKTGGLSCVAWSSKGQWLATGASDGVVSLFSVHGIEDQS